MRFFCRKAAVSDPVGPRQVDLRSGQRPSRMREGAQFALLDGDEDLEVVGESFYQPTLWQLAGARRGRERVRKEIRAVLVPEDDNPYDPNAVAVDRRAASFMYVHLEAIPRDIRGMILPLLRGVHD